MGKFTACDPQRIEDTTQSDSAAMLFDKLVQQIRFERPGLLAPFADDFQRKRQNRRKARLVQVIAPNPLAPRPRYDVALIGMIQEIADFLHNLVVVVIRDHLRADTEILREALALLGKEKTAWPGTSNVRALTCRLRARLIPNSCSPESAKFSDTRDDR